MTAKKWLRLFMMAALAAAIGTSAGESANGASDPPPARRTGDIPPAIHHPQNHAPPPATSHSIQPVACWALPSNNNRFLGHFIGGGCTPIFRGDPRRIDEGTWGWDFQGLIPRRVNNAWWHGRRYQHGTGAYKTDGPHYHEN